MLARIYLPAKTAMQSGRANTKEWVLDFEPASARVSDPLMGWTQTGDMNGQVRIAFDTREAPGTVIIDTGNTTLYFVLGQGRAIRYGVGVGREGFTWSGTQTISRKAEWPDWHPPTEMIARQP